MTTWPIGAESDSMKCAAQLCLVLGMAVERAELVNSVSKLTFISVLTCAIFLERSAQFCLISRRVRRGSLMLTILSIRFLNRAKTHGTLATHLISECFIIIVLN